MKRIIQDWLYAGQSKKKIRPPQPRYTNRISIHPQSLADWTLLFVCSWTLSLFTLEMIMTSCVHSCTICIHAACWWNCLPKWIGRREKRMLLQYLKACLFRCGACLLFVFVFVCFLGGGGYNRAKVTGKHIVPYKGSLQMWYNKWEARKVQSQDFVSHAWVQWQAETLLCNTSLLG